MYLFHLGWVTLVVDWFTWVWPSVRGFLVGVVLERLCCLVFRVAACCFVILVLV